METSTEVVIGADAIRQFVGGLFTDNQPKLKMVYGVSNLDRVMANFPEHAFNLSNPTRAKAAIPSKLIYCSNYGPIFANTDKIHHRQSKFLSPHTHPFSCDFTVIADNVFFLVTANRAEPVGINIRNSQMADDYISLFELLWNEIPD